MSSWPDRTSQYAFDYAQPSADDRCGPRRDGLRQVDYSPFPRVSLDAGNNLGLLLNESDAGLCLVVAEKEPVGSLLRVVVRGLHGRTSRDVVARVVWCSDAEQGRTRLGLELLRESRPQMLRVRYRDGQRSRSIRG
jgi:hypothetical protein